MSHEINTNEMAKTTINNNSSFGHRNISGIGDPKGATAEVREFPDRRDTGKREVREIPVHDLSPEGQFIF